MCPPRNIHSPSALYSHAHLLSKTPSAFLIMADHYIHIIEPFVVRDSENNHVKQGDGGGRRDQIKIIHFHYCHHLWKKRYIPPYGCVSATGMRLKAVIRWEAEDSFASLQRWIANVRASWRGKPGRAAYHLKNTPFACTKQLPAWWCATQNVWAVTQVPVCILPHLQYWKLDEALCELDKS